MKYSFLLLCSMILFGSIIHAQRSGRRAAKAITTFQPEMFEGRFFNVDLSNADTIPILLKLGYCKQIENGDTLNLARSFNCGNSSNEEYYDLHDLVSEEDNCIRWYSLQLIEPGTYLSFVVKLKDYEKASNSKLYYCFTKELQKFEKELNLAKATNHIVIMRGPQKFSTACISLNNEFNETRLTLKLTH